MLDKQALQQQLATPEFYKKVFPGMLRKGKRRDAQETWDKATRKGIADAVLLSEAVNGSFLYKVYAFSVNGSIQEDVIEELKEQVNAFGVNQIRYEAVGVQGYFAVYDKDGKFFQEDYEIMALCRQTEGIYIVIISETEADELDCPYIVYTFNPDGSLWFWTMARKYL